MADVDVDKQREATASIRGYLYQLDAALLEILNSDIDDQIVIEGIEDFDRYSAEEITYCQVKYYAGKDLTNSVLRDPLYKLFQHFLGLDENARKNRKYSLYGFYADIKISTDPLTVERFKEIMEVGEYIPDAAGVKRLHKKSLLDDAVAADEVIEAFCQVFRIQLSSEFFEHRSSVIATVKRVQGISLLEAEGFHYPRAFDFIASMATKADHNDRTTTRRALQEHLKGTQAVHRRWLLREKDASEYGKYMRQLYFAPNNSAGVVRTFIIDVSTMKDSATICDQLREIARKWSSAKSKTTPNNERYAPFVVLRHSSADLISQVKNELFDTGTDFVDGFPYNGSAFRAEHLNAAQTKERQIALRFADNTDQLLQAVEIIGRKLCHFYDFFFESPLVLEVPGAKSRMVSIPVDDIATIKKII
ncbi:hypothetical protein HFO33_35170 [Rhizobium leguminosarum]|uniref:DUF4297 family anti-phage-associated protein n=1 Tax=Rhizobium leguminosarum TaxID=384 RepID=UPI001C95E657|nr:DUF4297 family anti-phage-associated protein [Rhizobium leguminosarum]MBY5667454.1 hypothetical protein [Rhizobium leguminosarum]MBY5721736.1 hypothetical protein [Rhizobium leguminosarum]